MTPRQNSTKTIFTIWRKSYCPTTRINSNYRVFGYTSNPDHQLDAGQVLTARGTDPNSGTAQIIRAA